MSKIISPINKVSFIGSGSWALALAFVASHNAKDVTIHTRNNNITEEINRYKTNKAYVNDIHLPLNVCAETGYNNIKKADLIVVATPVSAIEEIADILLMSQLERSIVLVCSKGICSNSLLFPTELLGKKLPNIKLAVLSGPNFAKEVLESKLTKTVIASYELDIANAILQIFQTNDFYPVISKDVIGVQICGALKNTIAIAVGFVYGLSLGENLRAALITEGLKEISDLVLKLNGKKDTIYGIAGMGDLILTCGSLTSRNVSFGCKFAKGEVIPNDITVEGVNTVFALNKLSKKLNIQLKISESVYKVLYEKKGMDYFINSLKKPII